MSASTFFCCPRCGTLEPTILRGKPLAHCEFCQWTGQELWERSQDDPAPPVLTLRWLRGVHPSPEHFDCLAELHDETTVAWTTEDLMWLCELIGDDAGCQLAEMAWLAWDAKVDQLDTTHDSRALRHVCEQVAAEAWVRREDQREGARERVSGLVDEMRGAEFSDRKADAAHADLLARLERDAKPRLEVVR